LAVSFLLFVGLLGVVGWRNSLVVAPEWTCKASTLGAIDAWFRQLEATVGFQDQLGTEITLAGYPAGHDWLPEPAPRIAAVHWAIVATLRLSWVLVLCILVYHWIVFPFFARGKLPRCQWCGYILHGIAAPRCPECGEAI
jgi:hypothetical protein